MTTRRKFLTSAASGLGLAALASLLDESRADDPLTPRRPHFEPAAQNCIFIFLIGGVSQIDLLDPKPTLERLHGQPIPESFRRGVRLGQTTFNAPIMAAHEPFRRYGQCGMELSTLLPNIGGCADDIALIRSMHHEAFDHAPGELEFTTGKDQPGRPTMGSWLVYGLGSESRNLPSYVVLLNGRAPKSRSYSWGSGFLPATYQGTLFRSQGTPVLNLQPPADLSRDVNAAQIDAIRRLDEARREATGDPALDAHIASYELAFRMQTSAPELLDLSGETRATLTSYTDSDFGRSLLLARRLVERGVRFVTVTHHVWDHHDNIHRDLPGHCRMIDGPIATLMTDLKRRGLFDQTLVVCGTEFGRTAITQGREMANAGRDHHPHAFSVWLAGAGVRGGTIHGASDELGWRVAEDPVHTHDFHATLLHLFGIDHRRLTFRHQGLDMRLTDVAGRVVNNILKTRA